MSETQKPLMPSPVSATADEERATLLTTAPAPKTETVTITEGYFAVLAPAIDRPRNRDRCDPQQQN